MVGVALGVCSLLQRFKRCCLLVGLNGVSHDNNVIYRYDCRTVSYLSTGTIYFRCSKRNKNKNLLPGTTYNKPHKHIWSKVAIDTRGT